MNLQQDLRAEYARLITRRWFFRQCGVGLGSVALASLLGDRPAMAATAPQIANPLAPKQPPSFGNAKRVIYLFMAGAPSQLDLFDYKTALAQYKRKTGPPGVVIGQTNTFLQTDVRGFYT